MSDTAHRRVAQLAGDLTAEERAAQYRATAEAAEAFAARALNPGVRGEYLRIAGEWRALADQVLGVDVAAG